MGKKNPTIFLGDLARAVVDLGISDPETLKLTAQMLGFALDFGDQGRKASRDEQPDSTSAAAPSDIGSYPELPISALGEALVPEMETKEQKAIAIELTRVTGQKETWIPEVEPLPQQEEGPIATPPLVTLFTPQWTRGILSAAFSTSDDEGLLDIEGVTEVLARGESVDHLPTLLSLTLRRGVQLLLDKSQAMMPFIRDQAWLLREIRNLIGLDKMQVLRYTGSPVRGAGTGPRPWPDYQPPPPGVPVVVLTDLGIRQPLLASDWADEDEWADFARRVHYADCPLIAVVPYTNSRWPRSLTKLMTIVPWDRITTVATVTALRKTCSRP